MMQLANRIQLIAAISIQLFGEIVDALLTQLRLITKARRQRGGEQLRHRNDVRTGQRRPRCGHTAMETIARKGNIHRRQGALTHNLTIYETRTLHRRQKRFPPVLAFQRTAKSAVIAAGEFASGDRLTHIINERVQCIYIAF
jgi:hypothetical protein